MNIGSLYYYTFGRFIECARLYQIDLSDWTEISNDLDFFRYKFKVYEGFDSPDLSSFYKHIPYKRKTIRIRLLSDKYLCFCYFDNLEKRIAYVRWVCKRDFYSDCLKMKLNFDQNEAITLDSYTYPDYRHKGLHKKMNKSMLIWLKKRGYQRIYMVIKCFLPYLKKIPLQLGYKPILTRIYYKKGSLKNFFRNMLVR